MNNQPGKDIRSFGTPDGNDARQAENKDIQDSERDRERLNPDTATISLPDVKDIPGQENVTVLPLGELADTTISSDDEEGKEVFGDE